MCPVSRCRRGLRRDPSGSALPIIPQSVSRGTRFSRLHWFAVARPVRLIAPWADRTKFPWPTGGFYIQASDGSVTLPVAGYDYNSTGLLCWRDFHPQERQLASLHQIVRAEPQEARLVLIDPDLKRARRLDPVVVHLFDGGVRRQDLGHLEGDLAHLSGVRPAHAVLKRPADRRSQFKGVDPTDDARELGRKRLLQPGLDAFPLFQALRHNHSLGEEVVRELQVKRQVEPNRAPAHIGAPALHVRVRL